MKRAPSRLLRMVLTTCIFSLTPTTLAQDIASKPIIPETELSFKALFWTSLCETPKDNLPLRCGIPEPIEGHDVEKMFPLKIKAAYLEGQAGYAETLITNQDFVFNLGIYSIVPYKAAGLPPYLQIRLELISPVRAVCAQSIRWKVPFEAPPLICTALRSNTETSEQVTQFGVTLIPQNKP